jgi:hypothetical protein
MAAAAASVATCAAATSVAVKGSRVVTVSTAVGNIRPGAVVLSVIDRIPGPGNAWLTSGDFRTGILMAPVTAQMITHWIWAGQPPPEAADWNSAARFN